MIDSLLIWCDVRMIKLVWEKDYYGFGHIDFVKIIWSEILLGVSPIEYLSTVSPYGMTDWEEWVQLVVSAKIYVSHTTVAPHSPRSNYISMTV